MRACSGASGYFDDAGAPPMCAPGSLPSHDESVCQGAHPAEADAVGALETGANGVHLRGFYSVNPLAPAMKTGHSSNRSIWNARRSPG